MFTGEDAQSADPALLLYDHGHSTVQGADEKYIRKMRSIYVAKRTQVCATIGVSVCINQVSL